MLKRFRQSLFGTAIIVSAVVVVGKLLGFGREALIASYYGATWETDAFFFAQSMPAMIFPSVCSSVSTAFLSLYATKLVENGEKEGDRYASRMLTAAIILGGLLSGLGVLLAPVLVPILAPGFVGEQLKLAVYLTQLNMGAFILLMIQYMVTALLNAKKLFVGAQVAGLLYNVVIISVTLACGQGQSTTTLTMAVIIALTAQAAALVLCCKGHFSPSLQTRGYKRDSIVLLKLALPILLGNSVVQLNTIVDKALGSTLPDGSLSALTYGNTLSALVISIFVTSLSTVLYPTLTTDAAKADWDRVYGILKSSLSGLSFILIPISVIAFLDADEIVQFVYGRGSFDQNAVASTAIVLACYAPMFLFSGVREVLTRGFFAMQDTKTPMRNSMIGVGSNIIFSLLFVRWLGIAGIALGTTLSALITAVLLLRGMKKALPDFPIGDCGVLQLKGLAAGSAMLAAVTLLHQLELPLNVFFQLAADSSVGGAVYLGALYLLKVRIPIKRS